MEALIYPNGTGNINSKELTVDSLKFSSFEDDEYSIFIPLNDGKGEISIFLTQKQVAFLANSMNHFLNV